MSLVYPGVEVAGGPTVGLTDHLSLPVFLHPGGGGGGGGDHITSITNNTTNSKESEEREEEVRGRNGFCLGKQEEEESETSSIGVPSPSSSSWPPEEEEEVESKAKMDGPLGSLNSLEESLPIKRGLSNFFSGKSKSFASLSDVANATAKDLVKHENPFNKRRRLLMACRPRRASYSSFLTATNPPSLLAMDHALEEGEEEQEDENSGGESSPLAPLPDQPNNERSNGSRRARRAFRSPRSFSLSDLQHA